MNVEPSELSRDVREQDAQFGFPGHALFASLSAGGGLVFIVP
ncbi:MAG: hypothetical protein AAFX99_03715 [Myxococcota bacterium]